MSKLKVTTVNVVHKMEEQSVYAFSLNENKNSCEKETDEYFLNSTIEGNNTQESVKHKVTQNYQITNVIKKKCANYISCFGVVFLFVLDCLINICSNEWVRNVIIVFLTVCLEVFVVMVLAASTVLTTIIINIDDAYTTSRKSKDCEEITDDEIISKSTKELNENMESTRSSQDLPVREDSDIEDAFRLDERISVENIEHFATKLVKNNKLFIVSASEN